MSDLALSIVLGVALAAATGFRVFLPMLIVSGAAYTGHLHLDDSFAWLGTPSALIMLSVAAVAEVLAHYIPYYDRLVNIQDLLEGREVSAYGVGSFFVRSAAPNDRRSRFASFVYKLAIFIPRQPKCASSSASLQPSYASGWRPSCADHGPYASISQRLAPMFGTDARTCAWTTVDRRRR
jgi:hypothetical protein